MSEEQKRKKEQEDALLLQEAQRQAAPPQETQWTQYAQNPDAEDSFMIQDSQDILPETQPPKYDAVYALTQAKFKRSLRRL